MTEKRAFTLEQAMAAQAALRRQLSLPPEQFPIDRLIGMLSDEIELMRKKGHSDTEIANAIQLATQQTVDASDVLENYAPPDARRRS